MISLITKHPIACGEKQHKIEIEVVDMLDLELHKLFIESWNVHGGAKYRHLYISEKEDMASPLFLDFLKMI